MNGRYQDSGFGERGQEPFGEIPTEPEIFLRWAAGLDRHHPYKYELSRGKVSRTMINVSPAHSRVATNLLGELLSKLDRVKFEAGTIASLGTHLICSQDEPRAWVWSRESDGAWPKLPIEMAGRDGSIPLVGLGIEITMAAISRSIPDPPTIE